MHSPKIPTFCKKCNHREIEIFFNSNFDLLKKICKKLPLRNKKVGKRLTYLRYCKRPIKLLMQIPK